MGVQGLRPCLVLAALAATVAPSMAFSPLTLPSLRRAAPAVRPAASVRMQALREPPGKKKSFLTNLRESIEHIQDGDKFVAERSAEFGPVFSTTMFFRSTVVVGGPENVAELLAKEAAVQESSLPPPLQEIMTERNVLLMSGERHKQQKKIVQSLLSRSALNAYVPIIEKRMDEYLDGLVARGETYLAKDLTSFCLKLFAEIFSGTTLTEEEEKLFVKYNDGLFALTKVSPSFFRARKARQMLETNMQKRFDDVFAAGKLDEPQHKGWKNLYEAFRAAEEKGRKYAWDDVGYATVQMIWGAYIEAAALCCSCVMSTMDRPVVAEAALQEISAAGLAGKTTQTHSLEDWEKLPYTLGVIRETLRVQPPAGGGFRVTGEPLQIAGYDIPVGTVVTADPRIGNTDPKVFTQPDTFEPLRWVSRDLPTPAAASGGKCPFTGTATKLDRASWFPGGTGQHQCPGVPLAELVVKVFLAKWYSRVLKWEGVTPLEFGPPPIKIPKDTYKVVFRQAQSARKD